MSEVYGMKGKIIFENQHNEYIVQITDGDFEGLYARVDLGPKEAWLEVLWFMFFKWDPYAEWKPWEGEHEKEVFDILEKTKFELNPNVKQYLEDSEYRAECDELNEDMLKNVD